MLVIKALQYCLLAACYSNVAATPTRHSFVDQSGDSLDLHIQLPDPVIQTSGSRRVVTVHDSDVFSGDGQPEYPDTVIYTSQHTYFGPDPAFRGMRVGATGYAISHFLNNEIDGAAVLPDRNDSLVVGQVVGKLFGVGEDESFAIVAPFPAIFVEANLELDLNGMVDDPYGGHGHLAVLDGEPKSPPEGTRWMNSTEYEKFVKHLELGS